MKNRAYKFVIEGDIFPFLHYLFQDYCLSLFSKKLIKIAAYYQSTVSFIVSAGQTGGYFYGYRKLQIISFFV
ncbi:hypothetical protein EZS27_001910 [termite gut metagenome]|uniref:Uncharacterized protein n=1 Tax=termite gut metagenome TaxID=433724 RepID=A0A5J4SY75_9ZZZZ